MKQTELAFGAIVEWNPGEVRVFLPDSRVLAASAVSFEGLSSGPLRGKDVALLLGRGLTLVRSIPLPDVKESDLNQIVRGKLSEVFPLPAHELAFGVVKTSHKTVDGPLSTVFAARIKDINHGLGELAKLGANVTLVAPTASVPIEGLSETGWTVVRDLEGAVKGERSGFGIDLYRGNALETSRQFPSGSDLEIETERTLLAIPGEESVTRLEIGNGSIPSRANGAFKVGSPIHLEPEEVQIARVERIRRRNHFRAYGLFAVGAAILTLCYLDWSDKEAKAAKEEAKAKKLVKDTEVGLKAKEARIERVTPQFEALKRAFEPAQSLADIVVIVNDLVPKDLWLNGVQLERGKTLTVRGTSRTSDAVATYVKSLGMQQRFRDVRLLFANEGEIEGVKVVQFSVSMFPVGNLPFVDTSKKAQPKKKA